MQQSFTKYLYNSILRLALSITESSALRHISTWRNDWRFRHEIAAKLFRHETIFNFHMNNFGAIIRKTNMALTTILLVKKRLLLLKLLIQTENKNGRKKKRFWVRKLHAELWQKGEFHLLVRDLRLNDHEYFFKCF